MISFFYVISYCHLSATLQAMSITVGTYKTVQLWFEFFYVISYCHLSATLQTMSINVETYKTVELWFEFLSCFQGFQLTLPRINFFKK